MRELEAIIKAFEEVSRCHQVAALATVVKVSGSTYRQPGARMLLTSAGQTVGSISGGCLEDDVLERSREVMVEGGVRVVQYDTRDEDDIVHGVGLGCKGVVHVLIERLIQHGNSVDTSHLTFLSKLLHDREPGVLAAVFRVGGQVNCQVGDRLMLRQDQPEINQIQDNELAASVLHDARGILYRHQSVVKAYELSNGSAEVLLEAIQPPLPLAIFGAGYDAIPLAHLAKALGWHVTVVDRRPAYAVAERFPLADAVILCHPEAISEHVHLENRTVAVVMTHNYLHDINLLKVLLPSPVRYIGVLGPQSRTERLLQELRHEGFIPTDEHLRRLYGPVGLDIGANTPEEIALAILVEIQAVLTNRTGGFLRERQGPIHNRSEG